MILSLPAGDIAAFIHEFGLSTPNLNVVADESYCHAALSEMRGWHAQQVCKLMSHHVVTAEFYPIIDSDFYFIRDVDPEEFIPARSKYIVYGSSLWTVLRSDNQDLIKYLHGDPSIQPKGPPPPSRIDCKLSDFVAFRDMPIDNPGALERSSIPFKVFGAQEWIFYQPGQIFSREILISFEEFLAAYGLSCADIIRVSPWENNWYGEFAASKYYEETEFRVSGCVHFQSLEDIEFAHRAGLTEADLALRFFAVAMASRHIRQLKFGRT